MIVEKVVSEKRWKHFETKQILKVPLKVQKIL